LKILSMVFGLGTLLAAVGVFCTDRIIKARAAQESAAAKESAAKVQADLITQQERTAKAEKEILEVQEQFRRRTLTQRERDTIVSLLRAYLTLANEAKAKGESFMIVHSSDEGEPSRFANLLYQLFFQAGWSVQIRDTPNPEHVIGTSIIVRDSKNPPLYAQVVQNAFREMKLPVSVREEKDLSDKQTFLEVGSLH
jgi:hypothetical protein